VGGWGSLLFSPNTTADVRGWRELKGFEKNPLSCALHRKGTKVARTVHLVKSSGGLCLGWGAKGQTVRGKRGLPLLRKVRIKKMRKKKPQEGKMRGNHGTKEETEKAKGNGRAGTTVHFTGIQGLQ